RHYSRSRGVRKSARQRLPVVRCVRARRSHGRTSNDMDLIDPRERVLGARLAEIGRETQRVVGQTIVSSGISGVSINGLDQMWMLRFESAETEARFLRAAVRHG